MQPSILRYSLSKLPKAPQFDFIDFGCGKGRALLIASEYGFRSVIGIEYSPILARIARRNARRFFRISASRCLIDVVVADATQYPLPSTPIVIFFYNSFPERLVELMVRNIEATLHAFPRDLFVVTLNPVSASTFDASPVLKRYFAEQVPYDVAELNFGPDRDDAVVIWCNRDYSGPLPTSDRDAEITVLSPMRAILSSSSAAEANKDAWTISD